MANENLSGVPPTVTLSGLNAGTGGGGNLSGTPAQGIGGTAGGGMLPGMEGGLSLEQLMQMLQSQGGDTTGVGSAGSIGQPLDAGAFSGQQGGLGAGSFGQTQPGYVAGQSNTGSQGSVGSNVDPFSIIQKFLGTAQQGAKLVGGASTASPTATGGSDLALNTDLGGLSGTGSNAGVGTPSPTIEQSMQGTLGSSFLNDPTLSSLFTSGKLNGLSPAELSQLSSLPEDQLAGLRTALMSGETQSDLGNQLLGGQGAGGFTLGTGAGGAGDTNYLGAGQGGLTGLMGLLNAYQGLQSGNAGQVAGGGLQTAGGLTQLLSNTPGLAQALGLSGGTLVGAGAGIGGLGGLLSLMQGIQSGNPMQIGTGALGTLQGASALSGQLGGTTIASTLASVAPEATAQALSALTGTTIAATSEGIAAGISAAAAAYALPVAAVIQVITDTLAQSERERVANSGFLNNPIKGGLYSNATQSVGNVNDMLTKGGDLSGVDTGELGRMLTYGANNLTPYYQTAQGGRGAIRASDTITGAGPDWSAKAYTGGQTPEQYTQNFTQAQGGLNNIINELMKRGTTYEQLGQLPITGDWAQQSLDMSDPLQQLYQGGAQKYNTEAQQLLAKAGTAGRQYMDAGEANQMATSGLNPATFGYAQDEKGNWFKSPYANATPEQLFQAALGSSQLAPEKTTHASGLYTGMFGGPLWAMLSRMGAGGPETQQMIQQHFDPWANLRNFTPEQLGTSLMPILQGAAFRNQYDTGSGAAAGGPAGF